MPGRSTLPAETRLILGSDGSTTLLLESLLGVPLAVHVLTEAVVTADELSAPALRSLALPPDAELVSRSSELRTPQGHRVSSNRVLYPHDSADWLRTDRTPLGHRLRGRGTAQHRELLGSGLAVWDAQTLAVCAFKEYLIRCADGQWFHVSERFNPAHVPVTERTAAGAVR
ncbi:hypothetical protein C7C46_16620 [Streptomyces tateyamensis]|uniref:Chorismate lyase n=1 Tax=Streptomyces tateyamensis TaxID=565073 RepID=A0A2V4NQ50_9ACTN|nr:hypothetical protein [Streptomyces tateyamensis]PYC78258.1 hypothetical protein C7C46_16620 [Streptomyces tateyamensis]